MNAEHTLPTHCPHCGDSTIAYKSKAALWECQACEERFSGLAPELRAHRVDDRAARPKAIFFSYGHDANRELVLLFKADLEKRGHQVWFDEKDIGNWDDWKGKITRGIDASQLAIAFMSKHSIRDPGVCRNEIAIAMNRFGEVYPILLEAGIEQEIPITIRHLQWPDLSQWKSIRDGLQLDDDWNRWYEEKLLNLIEKIEGDATRFADETRVLSAALQPAIFATKITQHVPGFIGREWLLDAYHQWVDHQPESRLFWIKAGPGVGKSAIAANLAHRERAAIAASWFCDAKSGLLKDPDSALKSIAFQLALRWEDYRVKLLRKLELYASATNDTCEDVRKELAKKNTQDLFLFLLAEPMAGLIWREHKLVIVIDALDEASDEQGKNRITELISTELSSLPEWIGFVVTSRPEAEVVNQLGGFKPFTIDAEDPRNIADLRNLYHTHLGQRPELSALSTGDQQHIENLLIDRSNGMILYLKVVEEGFREGSLTVSGLEQLESGLPGLYRRYYDSFQQRFGSDYESVAQPLLRLFVAAGGPLPEDLACKVLGWNSEQFLACRNRIGSYAIETAEGYELFHKTLGEWLMDKSSGTFHLDRAIGRQMIADVLFKEIDAEETHMVRWRQSIQGGLTGWLPQLTQYEDAHALNNLGGSLAAWGDYKDAYFILGRALSISKAAMPRENTNCVDSLHFLANLLKEIGRYEEAETYCLEAVAITQAALPKVNSDIVLSLNNLALLLFTTCRYQEAESLIREALAIMQETSPDVRPGIGISVLNCLALLLKETGRYQEAESRYREALAIAQAARSKVHPEIGLILGNLATVLSKTGRYKEAESLYLESLAIAQATLPGGHQEIGVCLNNLALHLKRMGRYQEAESLYREALAITQVALPKGHPAIGLRLNNLANLLAETGRYQEAEQLNREALAIVQTALPKGHLDIGATFNTLGDILSKTGRYEEAEAQYHKALAIAQASLPKGHLDIGGTLNKLGVLLGKTGRYDEIETLYRETLGITQAALPTVKSNIGESLNNLALLLEDEGNIEAGNLIQQQRLAFLKSTVGAEHEETLLAIHNLAVSLRDAGHLIDAEHLQREAITGFERVYGENSLEAAICYSAMGALLALKGEKTEAEIHYRKALKIRERELGAEDEQTQFVRRRLNDLLA